MIRLRTLAVGTAPDDVELPAITDRTSVAQLAARAEAALAAGRWREAYRRYTDAMVFERRARDCVGAAVAADELGERDDAVAALELALDRAPGDVDLLLDVASLALRFDQGAIALRAATRAVELGDDHPDAAAMVRRVQTMNAARGEAEAAAIARFEADLADPVEATRAMAADALADLGADAAAPALAAAMAGDASPRVRVAVARALGILAGPAAIMALATAVGDASAEVRAAVAEALGTRPEPRARAPLEGLAGDADPRVRTAAARSLAALDAGE